MDLHRLRVVEFDTSVKEKEHMEKNNVQLEECIKEDREASTVGKRDQIGDENQCLQHKTNLPGLPKKCGEEMSHHRTFKNQLGDTSDLPRTLIKNVNDEVTPKRTSKKCSGENVCPPGTSKKHINNILSMSHLGTSKSQRTKSEIFKIPPRKKPRKRALKINSSDIGLTKLFQNSAYFNQKKPKINLPNKNRSARLYLKEENIKKKNEKCEDVHFLFTRETPSFIRYRRKRADNERTIRKYDSKLTNDIYGFQRSIKSRDQYQISFLNFIDTDKLPFKKMRAGFHRKRKPPPPVKNCYCKHHAMRVLNSACGVVGSPPIYYNLGTHPHPRRYDCDQEGLENGRSFCMAKDKTVEVSPSLINPVCKSLRDAGTGSSNVELYAGSCQRPPRVLEKSTTIQNFTVANEYNQKPSNDGRSPSPSAAYTALSQYSPCELKKSQTFEDVTRTREGDQKPSPETNTPTPCELRAARTAPAQSKCKRKRKKTKKTSSILTECNQYLSRLIKLVTDFHLKNKFSGKNCIKYVFYGVLIVVWSPCLLAIMLAWVVMFPWKLTNILKTDGPKRSFPMNYCFRHRLRKNNLRREYQEMCFEDYLPEKKRSLMTLVTSFFSRTGGAVVNSINAAISLLKIKKNAPMGAESSFLPSSHPNPSKRYKLFYAENRGWVMKPLRCRTRSFASNRVLRSMRCEFRPKFWQKSRGYDLKRTSLTKVPFPVHENCFNLRHHCSPAGDACPVQRNLWPSCGCWEQNRQRPKCMPLKSHHRRHQVNIPSTFFYPTSGIASMTTDEKVITNSNNLNSNELENYVSHKDLAQDYRDERLSLRNYGLPGKTFSMSTKCSSSLLLKGLQGQFPKCSAKHNAGHALLKAPGAHRMTRSRDDTNGKPYCKFNRLQLRRHTSKVLICPSTGNQNLAQTNKNSRILEKKINFCKKSVLTDTLTQSAFTKHANTSTRKVSGAHKTQNTSKHIPCQKVRNKSKKAKTKLDKVSKCDYDAKRYPAKEEFKYKTNNHITTQKRPSTTTINKIILNYSFENNRKVFKQNYKYKPDLIPVAAQMLLNTADITTMTNRNVISNCSSKKKHEKCKYCCDCKPHQRSIATQKQMCTADITTSTNRNVAFNCPSKENHGLNKHDFKLKQNPIPVATQMQSANADITTSTHRNVALNYSYKEDYELSKYDYKRKTNKTPVATQMRSKTADITTSTNHNVALNCPSKENHELSKQPERCDYKRKPNKIPVATQMQSRTADITTSTKRNVALNCPSKEKHELSKQPERCDYKRKPNKIPVASQMQSRTADITTSTNRNVALNCPSKEKHELSKQPERCDCKIPVAIPMQSSKSENAIDNRNLGWNWSCEENFGLFQHDYEHKPHDITMATQKRSRTADNATDTNRDVTLEYPSGVKPSTANKELLCIASTADKETKHIQKNNLSATIYKYLPDQIPVATQKQSNKVDITTMTNRDTALNFPCNHKQSEKAYTCKPDHFPATIQKQPSTADIITSTKHLGSITPRTATNDVFHACIPSTTSKNTACTQKNSASEYLSKKQDISIQKQSYKIDASVNCVSNYKKSKIKDIFRPEPILSPKNTVHYTEKTAPLIQSKSFKKVVNGVLGDKGSRKIKGLFKGTQSVAFSALKEDIDSKRLKRALPKKMVDYGCGITRKPTAIAAEFPIDIRQADENIFAQYPSKEPPNLKSNFVGETLEVRRVSTSQPLSTRQLQMEKFIKPFHRDTNSQFFGIASDCGCSEIQQNESDKELKRRGDCSKNIYTRKTGSAKESPSRQSNITEIPTRTLQGRCETNHSTAAERNLYKKVSSPKSTTAKETKSKLPQHLPLSKSLSCRCRCKTLFHKCRSNLIERVQTSVDKQYHGKESCKVHKLRSQCPKSLSHTKSLPRRYWCLAKSPQNILDKQPYNTKLNKLTSKKNVVNVNKTQPKLHKSSKHAITSPQKYLHLNGTCPVKSRQDSVDKNTCERPRKSFFSRKFKHNSIDIPDGYPCTSSQNYLNKRSFISDVPVNLQTAKQSLNRSCGRTEYTCSVNELSSRVQSSRISQYSSKVSSLVMSLRSKLFSRKSNQKIISNKPTKKPPAVIVSSLQIKPKKVDKRDISKNYILESKLDAETNQSHFRQSHKSIKSQNLSLPLHSCHNSCSSVIHESPLRQFTKKNRYVRKPIVHKSYACLYNKARTFQRPSFLSHSSKYKCRSRSIKVDQRVSQSAMRLQSKTLEHSSIVTLLTRKSRSKSQSAQIKSQKFDPQYFSSLITCQPKLTAKQAMLQEVSPSSNTLKSKRSSLFNQPDSKPLIEKLKSISDKIAANSRKNNQVSKLSTLTDKVKTQFEAISQQPKVEQDIPIIPGKWRCARDKKHINEHLLNITQQFDANPQQLKAKKVTPIVSGRYRFARDLKKPIKNSLNKKLQSGMELHNFTTIRPINNINSRPFRNVKVSGFSQILENEALKSPVDKLKQFHSSQQTGIPLSTLNSQTIFKKPYKSHSYKHSKERDVPNGLNKIAKKRVTHQSIDKYQKSHLHSYSCSCSTNIKRFREHLSEQQCDTSQSAEIQSNLPFQINQQNRPDQKRKIQIPTNVDNPSHKSLQQHSDAPGHAQKTTADGEVAYPDFNRVLMRYPALDKTSPEQSLQIPGIDCPLPANNYPPAPGATPPPNYACDRCFKIRPRVLKSSYDESALRRAYNRRPLRYTPPKQQLPKPKVVVVKKSAEPEETKGKQKKQSFFNCLRSLVNKSDRDVWPTDSKCEPMSLMKKNNGRNLKYLCKMLVYFLTLCFWSPLLCCAYVCCNVLCNCCS